MYLTTNCSSLESIDECDLRAVSCTIRAIIRLYFLFIIVLYDKIISYSIHIQTFLLHFIYGFCKTLFSGKVGVRCWYLT